MATGEEERTQEISRWRGGAPPMGLASAGETYETSACRVFLRLTGGGALDIDRLHPHAENTHWDRVCYRLHLLVATANSPACIPSAPLFSITAMRGPPTAQVELARVAGTHAPGPATKSSSFCASSSSILEGICCLLGRISFFASCR